MKDLIPVLGGHWDIMNDFLAEPDKLKRKNPHGYHKIERLHELYQTVRRTPERDRRRVITEFLAKTTGRRIESDRVYDAFEAAIRFGCGFLESLVLEFLPEGLHYPFTSDGVVTPTSDPMEILELIWDPPGSPEYRPLRCYQARLFWHLGMRVLLMNLANQPLASQLRDITLWLEEQLFSRDHGRSRSAIITSSCDPNNFYRYSETPTETCVQNLVSYRYIAVPGSNALVPVLYNGRIKTPHALLRKVLLKSAGEIPVARDYCAMTLVFLSEEGYRQATPILRRSIFPNGDAIIDLDLNGEGGKSTNAHTSGASAPEEKFIAYMYGALTEVQIFRRYSHYFNRRFSLGKENHHLYRMEQVLTLLRVFYPKALYLVDWDDPEILKQIHAKQIRTIEANYRTVVSP